MSLKRFIRNNRYLIPMYRIRCLILVLFYFMSQDLKYETWKSLFPVFVFCLVYTIYFLLDNLKELNKRKGVIWLFKRLYYISATIFVIWINIISLGQIVLDTGFAYSNFSMAIPSVFIVTSIIIIIPLYSLLILFMAIFYEMKFLFLLNKIINCNVFIKFLHGLIMFILPFGIYWTIWNKAYPFVADNIVYPFRHVFVYSSYHDIPNQCINKSNLIEQFGRNIQIAFISHEIISIAIPDDNKSYIFLEDKCQRKEL